MKNFEPKCHPDEWAYSSALHPSISVFRPEVEIASYVQKGANASGSGK
jgi:hypothetical protein